MSPRLNWNDVRFALAVLHGGSLVQAGRRLGVEHTTVGRRIDALERDLGVRLFTRTRAGYTPTADIERLLPAMMAMEQAVLQLERDADAAHAGLEGRVRVTSPETLGTHYLAPRLAMFGAEHPRLSIELVPAGEVLDLGRREAEIGIRTFRTDRDDLVVRKLATVGYGAYATPAYLKRRPAVNVASLDAHRVLCGPDAPGEAEAQWLKTIAPDVEPAFISVHSAALLEAAKAGAGLALLPRYLGDAEAGLRHVALPKAPTSALYLTVHRDLRKTPRVRVLMDFLIAAMKADATRFAGPRDR